MHLIETETASNRAGEPARGATIYDGFQPSVFGQALLGALVVVERKRSSIAQVTRGLIVTPELSILVVRPY